MNKSNHPSPGNSPAPFATLDLPQVFHVGQMDPALKGTFNTSSLEGNGLSVSLHPEEWRQIARLGGNPTWSVSRPGAQFVDAHALSDQQWQDVTSWAEGQGLLAPTELISLHWIGGEMAEPMFMQFDASDPLQLASASAEYESLIECDDDCEARLERSPSFKATPAMNARAGFVVDIALAKDIALTMYTEDVLFAREGNFVCGVWWDDELDVYGLSAPRGVIHRSALPLWTPVMIDEGSAPVRQAMHGCAP